MGHVAAQEMPPLNNVLVLGWRNDFMANDLLYSQLAVYFCFPW